MESDRTIRRYQSSTGVTVYKLPVEAFPSHFTNCYLVLDDCVTLIDAASGWADANEHLRARFDELQASFGEKIRLRDIKRLLITHGHIDHFGGVNFLLKESQATLGIHELDVSVLQNFKERLILSTKNLHLYLDRTGFSAERVKSLLEMNKWSKDWFQATPVNLTLREGPLDGSSFYVHHVPGHCPGEVCLQLHDLLFTGDHVLHRTTPNQSPEFITRYTGLGHYLDSLKKIGAVAGVRVGLGGHERDIADVPARAEAIRQFHEERLARALEICRAPKSLADVSRELFGKQSGYHVLLAILETGAHVEYLYERGHLVVANMDKVEQEYNPVLLYQAR
ncbi:MAG: MBL fold metallo-hydrolase [Candidatus Hydrogenedentes bacterium]|nr:MBL fold metallo-hydrolase [Candidatus Hydrogenedentota bacterium]